MRQGGLILQQGVCVRRKQKLKKKKTTKSAPPKTHHEIYSTPATANTSRRVPRVSPCSPASIDPGLLESGLVQFS